MTQLARRWIPVLLFLAFAFRTAPASAQITVGGEISLANAGGPSSAAFDSVNQVYLVVSYGPPIVGQFLDKNGSAIGTPFNITPEVNLGIYLGWSSVAAGGTASDPAFLVTYVTTESSANPKFGRLVRYQAGGVPSISDRTYIANVTTEWYSCEKSRNIWDGTEFIVGTTVRPAGAPNPVAQLQHFDLNGNVSSVQILGDYLDFENARGLACSPAGNCIAVGWAAGIPWGSIGGVWARLFTASSLAPSGGLFYVDMHVPSGLSRPENQAVIYNSTADYFLTSWERAGSIEDRVVATNGDLGPAPDSSRNWGSFVGESHILFNEATGTTLLVTKSFSESNLYALELGDDGAPRNLANVLELINYATEGGTVNEYTDAIAADPVNGRWLVTARVAVGGVARLVQGTPVGLRVGAVVPASGSIAGGTVVTVSGSGFEPGATVTFGGVPATGVSVLSSAQIQATTPPNKAGAVAVVVSNTNGQSYSRASAFTYLAPSASNKLAPFYGTVGDIPITFVWTAVSNATYAFCVDTTNNNTCDTGWQTTSSSWLTMTGLNAGTYYWQVRTTTSLGTAEADGGNWWVFTIGGVVPPVVSPRRPVDFDGDGKSDVAIWRPGTGDWWILDSSSGFAAAAAWYVQWGASGDIPVPGDYDGDGITDVAFWRPSTGEWWILKSSTGFNPDSAVRIGWGGGWWGDIPVPGDYDGDGKTDPAIWRPSTGEWWIRKSTGGYTMRGWGGGWWGDVPVPGDYDGDGKTDLAIWRPSTGEWWILNSATNTYTMRGWGGATWGDVPVPGDYDGDGKTDLAIWRPNTGEWWILKSTGGYTVKGWGGGWWGDVPMPLDYDGDGKVDIAIWRPSTGEWWVLKSSTGNADYFVTQLGGSAWQDVPIYERYR